MARTGQRVQALPVGIDRRDVDRMLAHARNDRDRRLVELFWYSGGRISELLCARVGDLTDRGLRLVNLKQRGHAEKHVVLDRAYLARLRAEVDGQRLDRPLIGRLEDPDEPLHRAQVHRIFSRIALAAGVLRRRFRDGALRPAWPHTARHGNAINMLLQGVPMTGVAQQLGHSDIKSTAVYTKVADPDLEAALARVRF